MGTRGLTEGTNEVVQCVCVQLPYPLHTHREALQTAVASRAQQQQLCGMVPVVLVAKLGPRVMAAAARAPPRLQPEELGLGGAHPLDFLLLDTPLGGPLGLDPFLDTEVSL